MAIVCGTDFSESSEPVLRAAAALAVRLGDPVLWIVHVLDLALATQLDAPDVAPLRAKAEAQLATQAAALRAAFPLRDVQGVVRVGPASQALAQVALEQKAELLVVSPQGHGASPVHRLGGTSERLVAASQVPVLVVRDAAPFEAWSRDECALRVLVGVDWTTSSSAAVQLVKRLRLAGPCDVVVSHVYYSGQAAARYGLDARGSWIDTDPEIEALLTRDLAARVGELGGGGSVKILPKIGLGRLGDHLLEVAEVEKVDLVIVGTHRPRGLQRLASVSSVVLQFSHASVACVPATAAPHAEVPIVRRVLIPTDLSPCSGSAIPYGYGLVAQGGGDVHLVHVTPLDRSAQDPTAGDREVDLVARLRDLVPPWAAAKGIVTRTEVIHRTDVARAVRDAAARIGADVICMGSRGRSGLARMVLGSVAEEVVRESSIPVLIVRPPPP